MLLEQAAPAEILQKERVHVGGRVQRGVHDSATDAELAQRAAVGIERLLVLAKQRRSDRDFGDVTIFEIGELEITVEPAATWVNLLRREHLQRKRVIPPASQIA